MPRNEQPYIGEMDRQIELSYRTAVTSATGELLETDVLIGKVWAKIIDKAGGLNDDSEKVIYTNTREYIVRFNTVAWNNRITLNITDAGDKYTVRYASEVQRRKFLKLSCVIYE